jgi:hypothetical protein
MGAIKRFGKLRERVECARRLERRPLGDVVLRRHNTSHEPIIPDRRHDAQSGEDAWRIRG